MEWKGGVEDGAAGREEEADSEDVQGAVGAACCGAEEDWDWGGGIGGFASGEVAAFDG